MNPNIESITMTYGYMRIYEDRVRRCCSTPDRNGRFALWEGGMEPNIPVGSERGVSSSMAKAIAGAEREQREGANGKWVAHWKMVHIVRPVWEKVGEANQAGRKFPPLTHTATGRGRSQAARAGAAERSAARGTSSASRCSTAMPSDRASRPPRSSPPISSATTMSCT